MQVAKNKDFTGAGLKLHVYPDGKCSPAGKNKTWPTLQLSDLKTSATELGKDANWADDEYVKTWVAAERKKIAEREAGANSKTPTTTGASSSSSSNKGPILKDSNGPKYYVENGKRVYVGYVCH